MVDSQARLADRKLLLAAAEQLGREGFGTVVRVEREPHGLWNTHTHPFEAKALILSGEIRIRTGDLDEAAV